MKPLQHFFNGTLLRCIIENATLSIGCNGERAYSFEDDREIYLTSDNYTVSGFNDYAFAFCKTKRIVIPPTTQRIGRNCFYNCINIESIDLSRTKVQILPEHAFDYCTNLKEFKPPPSLIEIHDFALSHTSIEKLEFNLNLSFLSGCAFYQTYSLKFFEACPVKYPCIDGVIYNSISTAIVSIFPSLKSVKYTDTINNFNDWSFSGSLLEEITLKSCVKAINNAAFYNCTHLKLIQIEQGLIDVHGAWASFTSITSIKFPQSVIFFGQDAFCNSNFVEIDLSETHIVQIPCQCFRNCLHLKNLYLPPTLKQLGAKCFENTKSLVKIELPNSLNNVSPNAFFDSYITLINLTNTKLKTIKKKSFVSSKLQEVYLPRKLVRLDNHSFSEHYIHFIYEGRKQFRNCSLVGNVTVQYDYNYKTFCGIVVQRLNPNNQRPTLFVVE